MILLGALANGAAIFVGGMLGLLLRRGLPEQLKTTLLQGLGLCVVYIGINGSLQGQNALVVVLSVVCGAMIGEYGDFDGRLKRFGEFLQTRLAVSRPAGGSSFAEGFVTASIVVCVGAMAIVGSLQSGMKGNHEILFAKSLIDGVFALVLASTLGFGVCLAGIAVLVYEGLLSMGAQGIAAFLTEAAIREMTCAGSLLIIAIGLNMLKITEIRVANFLLVPFLPVLFMMLWG